MTIPINNTLINVEDLTTALSRYRTSKVIYYGNANFITFPTYLRKTYVPKGDEKVMMITKGVEFRPDLVSFDVYGFSDSWWRILEANGMHDIFEFQAGKTIIIPDIFR